MGVTHFIAKRTVSVLYFFCQPIIYAHTQDSSKRADLGSGRTVELRDGGRETGAGDSELCELPVGPDKGHRGLRQGPLHLHRVHPEETRRRERGAIQTSGEVLECFTSC